MDEHSTPFSRRRLLRQGAGLGALSTMAGGLLRPSGICAQEPGGFVLRATRFTAAPDGRSREVWGYNGQVPGPLLRVKEGAKIRVKVINDLGAATSIHWHGILQHGTWQMDGVDAVSRPPIAPGAEFTYEFVAHPSGTHWYHSHVGVQYGDGLFGPLIIEERTPIAAYDREDVLLINDWFHESGETLLARLKNPPAMNGMPAGKKKMAGMMAMKKDVADVPFQSALINGKGTFGDVARPAFTTVAVKRGETLRLRLINGSSSFAFRVHVDGHPLTVIAADGAPIKPVVVDHLTLATGERYDVLIKGDQSGVHWIRATTLDGHEALAVLRYEGTDRELPEKSPPRLGERGLRYELLRAVEPPTLAANPRVIPIELGGSMKPYRWSINGQYFPGADPIVLQKGEPIRFVIRNATMMDHPFHLHGHQFHLLGAPNSLNLVDPITKDTVNVPAQSELSIQWVASNPGRWFFHCHIEFHLATGMARVLEIPPF